jgi:hypothetical protein
LRATCTALRKAITDDFFLYQGKRVFQDPDSFKAMKKLLPEYLVCRVKRPLDVEPQLLGRINAMLWYLEGELRTDKSGEILRSLCKGFTKVRGYSEIARGLCSWNGQPAWLQSGYNLNIYDKTFAAMMVGATDFFHQLLPQSQDQEPLHLVSKSDDCRRCAWQLVAPQCRPRLLFPTSHAQGQSSLFYMLDRSKEINDRWRRSVDQNALSIDPGDTQLSCCERSVRELAKRCG